MLAAVCRKALGALGGDTGPMHIAGLCCPSLVLFSSSTDPNRNKPSGNKVYTLQIDNLNKLHPNAVIKHFNHAVENQ